MTGQVRMLSEQLTAALAEVAATETSAGEGEPFEVAVLAGLLSRCDANSDDRAKGIAPLLAKARQFCAAYEPASILPDESLFAELVDRFTSVEVDAEEAELQELLLDLDEVCAGVWFLDAAPAYLPMVEAIAATIRAYPEPFRSLSPWASRLLSQAPPPPSDPALLVLRAVEASVFPDAPEAPPLCIHAASRLEVLPRYSSSQLRSQAAAAAQYFSSTTLKPEREVTELTRGRDFEVGVTVDPQQGPILLIRCATLPTLARKDIPIILEPLAPTLYAAPAEPGLYILEVAGERIGFEVTD